MRDDISSPETSDDAKLEYEKVSVIIEYIDKVIAAIHEEKGEVDGEIKSDGVTITVETIDAPMVQPPDGVM